MSGSVRKRSRTPSVAVPDGAAPSTPGKRKASAENSLTLLETPRGTKRTKRGVTPGGIRRDGASYVVKTGMNALPLPVPPVTKAILSAHLASKVTACLQPLAEQGEASLLRGLPILPREVFVFGNGDMGQHGLGTEVLDEIKRPRRHVGIAKWIEEGKLGSGGLEVVAAGGMHTLAIDSTGQVSRLLNE